MWPLLLSHLPQGRFSSNPRPPWSPETLPRCQTFCPWPVTETGDTWLAGTGFWGKPPEWEWAGAPKGIHSSRSSSYSQSGVSFCWGSTCGWFWSPGCQVTSPCQGVVADWCVAIARVLRVGSPTVVTVYINCQPSEHRRNIVSGRGVGWYFPFYVSTYPCSPACCCCVLVDHSERDVRPHPFSRVWLGEDTWALQHWIWGARIRNLGVGVDMGKAHISTCLCGGVEVTILAKIVDSTGPDTSVVPLHRGPHVLAEAFASYVGSGYRAKLVEYPTFDLHLLKRCLQRTAASGFGSPDPFSMTSFVVNRLKGAKTRHWMASRLALRKAIITNDFSLPGFVDVVANIVAVWPLVVSYLEETGRKDDGDSLVVRSSTVVVLSASCKWAHHFFVVLEEGDGRVSIPQSKRAVEVQADPSSSRSL